MFIELLGHRVHTMASGRGERTLLGIAGAFGNMEIWQQPFELLSKSYATIAYDHFGTGETRVPPELVTFDNQVALLEALMDNFSLDRCTLLADSTMVGVAVAVAARCPERIDALALVAGGVINRRDELTEGFVSRLRSNFEPTVERFVALCIPESETAHLRDWLRDIIHRTGAERAASLIESFYDVDVSELLPKLVMPTVVIQGEHDALPTSNLDAARAMAARIPDCRLEILPGAGHVPTLTRPKEVADIIERLIESRAP